MSCIPNQDHPASVPLVDLDPFDRPNDELFIALQGSEIQRNRLAEASKAASEALEASHELGRGPRCHPRRSGSDQRQPSLPPNVRIEQMVRASKAAEASIGLAMYRLQINAEKNQSIPSRLFITYPLRNPGEHGVHASTFGII
jgi:hypothetical protein